MLSATTASLAHRWLRSNGIRGSHIVLWACLVSLFALVSAAALAAPRAKADFGLNGLGVTFTNEDGSIATQAGSHPFAWTTDLGLNTHIDPVLGEVPDEDLMALRIRLPPGLIGTPALLPHCSQGDFGAEACPPATAVGKIELRTSLAETEGEAFTLYNLLPRPGTPAELGFNALQVPVRIGISISPDPPYNLVASITNVSQAAAFFGSILTIRGSSAGAPFLTLPRSCDSSPSVTFEASSWQHPDEWIGAGVGVQGVSGPPGPPGFSGCDALGFNPAVNIQPTTAATQATSGLHFSLDAPDEGLTSPTGIAQADLSRIALTLPEGMTVNAAVAGGLGACTPADYARETLASAPGAGCPESSKIGTAKVESPLLEEPISGVLYVAEPDNPATAGSGAENPFDSLLSVYLVLKNQKLGAIVKQATEVEADPATGRLTASIGDIPQLPVSHVELRVREGPRGPLLTPATCGAHAIVYRLTPSSGGPALNGRSAFALDSGCAPQGFSPKLHAGTTKVRAGATSPFVLDLTSPGGEQSLSALSLTLPRGLSAHFGAVPLCPESRAASGACSLESQVGSVDIVIGGGSTPLPIPVAGQPPGAAYLAGPYRGAPFSLVVALRAQAGPFDLGTVVTRTAVYVDPVTARAKLSLDPLPQILDGIPISYRAIHLILDRPGFILNPTNCTETASRATAVSATGMVAPPSDRFQVGGCGHLGFKPKVSVSLLGPTHRGAHPELRTVFALRRGDANVRSAAATLPATELLDSRHIRTVCTVAQFDAGKCPPASVYGHAKAWTRLLDRPLEGPVYLRASRARLPELVASLRGQIDLDLVSHIDSAGGRLRTTLQGLPDVPLSKVVLTMRGGKRGLLVNTGGLCSGRPRAAVGLSAQNGKERDLDQVVKTDCGKRVRGLA
jgi:hypothetical protein